MRRCAACAAVFALTLAAGSAKALVVTPIFDNSITSLPNANVIENDVYTVLGVYDQSFSNPATVYINFSWGSLNGQPMPSNAAGASSVPLYGYFTYNQVRGMLATAAANSPSNGALALASSRLPLAPAPGVNQYAVPSAEAKALGLIPSNNSASDGSVAYSGSLSSFNFNQTGGIPGAYDFEAVTAHEVGEVLGRISGLTGVIPTYRTPFDLFRFSAPGVPSFSYNEPSYFSIDGGVTPLVGFNTAGDADRGDWYTTFTTGDIQDAFVFPGQRAALTEADLMALDVLGWSGTYFGDTNAVQGAISAQFVEEASVPVPASLWTMALGLAALVPFAGRQKPAGSARP